MNSQNGFLRFLAFASLYKKGIGMTDLNPAAKQRHLDGVIEKSTDTLVVGAGQAGVAMSEHLSYRLW